MSRIELAGIPGDVSEAVRRLQWIKGKTLPTGTSYHARCADGYLVAILSRDPVGKGGKALWHISMSHRDANNKPDRVPTWDELKHGVYALIHDDVCMVLIFPRRTAPYVNIYDTCLHLYQTEEEVDL